MKVMWGESVWMDHAVEFSIGPKRRYGITHGQNGWFVMRGSTSMLTLDGQWVKRMGADRTRITFPDRHAALQALVDSLHEAERKEIFGL